MRFLGALVLSLVATVASFFATMIALDRGLLDAALSGGPDRAPGLTRVGAFAMPELAASTDLLIALRPHPALADGERSPAASPSPPETTPSSMSVRSAQGPPMLRRAPVDPVLASDAPVNAAPPAARPPAPTPTAVAQRAPPPAPARRPSFDTSTRSALGGPKPNSAQPTAVASKKAATSAASTARR